MTKKKNFILQREMQTYKRPATAYGYDHSGKEMEKMTEKRLDMIQQLKLSLLEVSGLSGYVLPIDDGTFEQDVLLTEQQSSALLTELKGVNNQSTRKKRSSLFLEEMPTQRWDTSQPIPYYFEETLEEFEKQIIRQAHEMIEAKTCIRFENQAVKPAGDFIYYIKISSPTFCGLSYIGKVKPLNPVYLSFMCQDPVGIVLHETMHTLGVLHQHLRVDRDYYLDVQWSNINPQLYDYFAIADSSKYTPYGVQYDYSSVMHYAPFTGAIDVSKPTMIPKFNRPVNMPRMGQRKMLTARDAELLSSMYCKQGCVDKNVYCGVWAVKQLCKTRAQLGWMQENCRKSCKFC